MKYFIIIPLIVATYAYCIYSLARTDSDTPSPQVHNLKKNESAYTAKVGDSFCYTGMIHPSVGYWLEAEYNQEAFSIQESTQWDNPAAVKSGMCGGDSGKHTITLKALKKGTYTIKIIHSFRGKEEKSLTFTLKIR